MFFNSVLFILGIFYSDKQEVNLGDWFCGFKCLFGLEMV